MGVSDPVEVSRFVSGLWPGVAKGMAGSHGAHAWDGRPLDLCVKSPRLEG